MTTETIEAPALAKAAASADEQSSTGTWTSIALAAPLMILVTAMVVYPVVKLVSIAVGDPDGVSNIPHFFDNAANVRTFLLTLRDSAIVTVVTMVLGSLVAWELRCAKSTLWRLTIFGFLLIPFWMGTLVKLYALTILFGRHGVISWLLVHIGLTSGPTNLLYTQVAVVAGMAYQMLPYAALTLYVGFLTIDLDLLRAAEGLGATRIATARTVVLPLALPALLASSAIVFTVSIGFYLTPVLLGGGTSPFTATLIGNDLFQFFDLTSGAVASLLLIVVGAAAVGFAYLAVGKERMRRALA